jgi:hypothetical protein
MKLECFVDADWAGDSATRRSTTGYLTLCHGNVVSWKSKLQPTVCLSSSEAEYVALSATSQEVVWLRKILFELGHDQSSPTVVFEDNQGAIALSENPVFHARTKHISIRHHYIRELVSMGIIQVQYISTTNQIADGLTKPLGPEKFKKFRDHVVSHLALIQGVCREM